jgi:threonine dehydrogenase-like Zn-dependent dehydrogenase
MFILGAGTIGLFCLAVAKVIGVREVIISAKYEHQAKMAEKLDADYIIRVPTQDVENEIKTVSKTKNEKVDVVIDTIATEQTFNDALSIVRKAGTVCLVGGYTKPLNASLRPIVSKELHVLGSACYSYSGIKKDFDAVIDIMATKKIDVIPLITHRFPLTEIEEAFKIAADKISGSIKVLINQ